MVEKKEEEEDEEEERGRKLYSLQNCTCDLVADGKNQIE